MAQFSDDMRMHTLSYDLSEVEDFLQGIDYPATKREILDVALDNGAPDDILLFLNTMHDREYLSFHDLMHMLEGMVAR